MRSVQDWSSSQESSRCIDGQSKKKTKQQSIRKYVGIGKYFFYSVVTRSDVELEQMKTEILPSKIVGVFL